MVASIVGLCGPALLGPAPAGADQGPRSAVPEPVELLAGPFNGRSFVPPELPDEPDFSVSLAPPQATFSVNYTGFTPQAQAAFQYAVDIWAQHITSGQTIEIDAEFTALDPGVLGSAGPTVLYADPGGPYDPVAIYNHRTGSDANGADAEIKARFSSTFNFYFGTDGDTPAGQYDFVSVVLHEIGHGLGITGGANYNASDEGTLKASFGDPLDYVLRYSNFVDLDDGDPITGLTDPSTELGDALTSDAIFFTGPQATAGNGGARVPLYSPATWDSGSSYSHLDESTYGAGNVNSLMTPQIGSAEAIHRPGPVSLGLLDDLGWDITNVNNAPEVADDSYSTDEDVVLDVPAATGVLSNDSDAELEALAASLVSGPSHGSLSLHPDGGFSYTPDANYFGPDSFTYEANDGTQDSASDATVSITVAEVNDPPVADDQDVAAMEDVAEVIALDASDVEGDALTYSLVTPPAHGGVAFGPVGTATYTPDPNWWGVDTFTYQVCDTAPACDTATVTVDVASDATSWVAFSQPVFEVNERYALNGRATITLVRTGDLSTTETVSYATADGTALAARDYVATSGTLTFGPGQSVKTFSVRLLRDTSTEGTETVSLVLSNSSDKMDIDPPNPGILNIDDDV